MKNVKQGYERPIVCLDPGHYGKYNHGVVKGYYESEMVWKLHLLLKAELEEYGITVTVTRTDPDQDLSLYKRGQAAKGADLFLSVHSNAASTQEPDYPLAICNVDGGSDAIGKALVEVVEALMGTVQQGQVMHKTASSGRGDWYTVLYASKSVGVPGVILEHSFHTNPRACAWLMVEENLRKTARREAAVIADYFGMDKREEQEPEPVQEQIYRVRKSWDDAASQLGAYKVLKNAKAACKPGYAVFDAEGQQVFPEGDDGMERFVRAVQSAIGAAVDGIAGPETLGKTPTVSATKSNRHGAVRAVQARLYELGYTQVGPADGIAGPKFTAAVKAYQKANGCIADGEITARNKTWRKLLDME